LVDCYVVPAAGGLEKRDHVFGHVCADFNRQAPTGYYAAKRLSGDAPVAVEAVDAASQCRARLPAAHFRFEREDLTAGYIRWIANHQVEPWTRADRIKKVASNKVDAMLDAMPRRVTPRDGQSGGGQIDRTYFGPRKFSRQRDGDCAATSTQVDNAQTLAIAYFAGERQGDFDQPFGLRAGN
jgi:hypothetical protein